MADPVENARPAPIADLIAECDRICGVHSDHHKDRCPLYKANNAAMAAWNRQPKETTVTTTTTTKPVDLTDEEAELLLALLYHDNTTTPVWSSARAKIAGRLGRR